MAKKPEEGVKAKRRTRRAIYTSGDDNADARTPRAHRFASKLNRYMLAKGWTQSELARQAELHLPAEYKKRIKATGQDTVFGRHLVSSYMRGVHLPNQIHLEALAKALGCSVVELAPPDENAVMLGKRADVLAIETTEGDSCRIKVDMIVPTDTGLEVMRLLRGSR